MHVTCSRVAAIAVALLLSAGTAAGEERCTQLVVTGHPSYAPVSWSVGDTLKGGAIALVEKLAAAAGVPVSVLNAGSWDGAQKAVETGRADLIVGIYKTPAREHYLDYVTPRMSDDASSVIVRRNAGFPYDGWQSLAGKQGLMSTGESYGVEFDAFRQQHLSIAEVDGFSAVLEALSEGRGDYALMGYYPAIILAPGDTLTILEKSFASEPMYIAFGKSSPCKSLAAAFGKELEALRSDGTIERLWQAGMEDYAKANRVQSGSN